MYLTIPYLLYVVEIIPTPLSMARLALEYFMYMNVCVCVHPSRLLLIPVTILASWLYVCNSFSLLTCKIKINIITLLFFSTMSKLLTKNVMIVHA